MACVSCASECLCAVVSGDNIISVAGVGSAGSPYQISADICVGLNEISTTGRDIIATDQIVVVTEGGSCELVLPGSLAAGTGLPVGGTVGQVLVKDSSTDYDVSWATPPYARVSNSTTTTLTTATPAVLLFDTDDTDPLDIHSLTSNTSRLTVPTSWGGWWSFGANVEFFGGTLADPVSVRLLVNGSVVARVDGTASASGAWLVVSAERALAVTDYIEVEVLWTGAGSMSIATDTTFYANWRAA
jgi:hypothetical protein